MFVILLAAHNVLCSQAVLQNQDSFYMYKAPTCMLYDHAYYHGRLLAVLDIHVVLRSHPSFTTILPSPVSNHLDHTHHYPPPAPRPRPPKMSISSSMTSISSFGAGQLGTGRQVVKLAIQSQPPLPPKQALLLDVAQNLQLTAIVMDVCSQWNIEHPERYTLKYTDLPNIPNFGYITEENRHKLKNGDILSITLTPPIQV